MTLILVLGAVFIVLTAWWRLWSNRRALPCPYWLSWLVELDNPMFRNNRAAAIIANLGLKPGMTVLDVGCGPGRVAIPIAKTLGPQGRVVCLDIQAEMLKRARAKAQEAGLENLVFRQVNIGGGLPEAEAFDRAVAATVLGEIPDKAAALEEIFKALKPCGVLAVTEVIADPHFQLRSSVARLAGAAGFRELRRTGGSLSYTLYLQKPSNF
jgi:ubiquinone/menaquinone biosynthesis C-methylase UbiE